MTHHLCMTYAITLLGVLLPLWLPYGYVAITVVEAAPEVNNASFPFPSQDPFYTDVPPDLASYPPGHVFRSRSFESRYDVSAYASGSYQYYYRSNDQNNTPIGTVGTLYIPKSPNTTNADDTSTPAKVVVHSLAEDSANLNCGPSFMFVEGSPTNDTLAPDGKWTLFWALSKGYYFVNTDAEGPNATWLVSRTEGHDVLDGIRGALSLANLTTEDATKEAPRIALDGYSGGAFTTLWATSLAQEYAPELNIVGAAHGGTPVDLMAMEELENETENSQLIVVRLVSFSKAYPSVADALTAISTSLGEDVFNRLTDWCADADNSTTVYSGYLDPLYTENVLMVPSVVAAMNDNSALSSLTGAPVPVPTFPRFIYHGGADKNVPLQPVIDYVAEQCQNSNADIRFIVFPGDTHAATFAAGMVANLMFLESALAKQVAPAATCGSSNDISTPAVNSAEGEAYLGPLAKLLQ